MNAKLGLMMIISWLFCFPALAEDAKPKVETAKASAVAATQPTPAPVDPSVKQPKTTEEAVDASKDFIGALKAHTWWFAAAIGIFLVLFVAGAFGLWVKIGTTWAWILVGVLSLAAGCFAAFHKDGFNWASFWGYISAGPTIAWLRDFIKDGILKQNTKKT
jgi:hypothetical protein